MTNSELINLTAHELAYETIHESELWNSLPTNDAADALAKKLAPELVAHAKMIVDREAALVTELVEA